MKVPFLALTWFGISTLGTVWIHSLYRLTKSALWLGKYAVLSAHSGVHINPEIIVKQKVMTSCAGRKGRSMFQPSVKMNLLRFYTQG